MKDTSGLLSRMRRRLFFGWGPYLEEQVRPEDLLLEMRRACVPTFGYFFMLGLSAAIATFGLIANSAPAIIGAMIIAPLMSPILSLAYGLVVFDRRLMPLSAISVAAGIVVVVFIAYVIILLFGMRIAGSEILSRTQPTLLDLCVALAAGGAAAFSQTRPSIANSIAGVAIAVALVPPLAVCGVGLALGQAATSETADSLARFGLQGGGTDIAFGAFVLFGTNLVGIVAVAMLVFIVQRYGEWRHTLLPLVVVIPLALLLAQPLTRALHEMYVKNRVVRVMAYLGNLRPELVSSEGRLESVNVGYRDGLLHVDIRGYIDREGVATLQGRADELRDLLSEDIGEPVYLEVRVFAAEFASVLSTPPRPEEESE